MDRKILLIKICISILSTNVQLGKLKSVIIDFAALGKTSYQMLENTVLNIPALVAAFKKSLQELNKAEKANGNYDNRIENHGQKLIIILKKTYYEKNPLLSGNCQHIFLSLF